MLCYMLYAADSQLSGLVGYGQRLVLRILRQGYVLHLNVLSSG